MTDDTIAKIPMSEIFSDEDFNCRGSIAPVDCYDLALDIKKNGLTSPIIVQPWSIIDRPEIKYRVVAGHRRHMAHKINEAENIECIVRYNLTQTKARVINLSENLKRKDLNILQEAKSVKRLREEGLTFEEISEALGMSIAWVFTRKQLLELSEPVQKEVAAGFINQEQIKQLHKIRFDEPSVNTIVQKIKDARLRGDKSRLHVEQVLQKDKVVKKAAKRVRGISEMFEMQEIIQANTGNSILTRLLAWTTGTISTNEFFEDYEQYCILEGVEMLIPNDHNLGDSNGTGGTDAATGGDCNKSD